jgi:ubiquitin-like-conjugating enzyme ATG3
VGRKATVDSAANPGEIDNIPDLDSDGLAGAIASDTGATVGGIPDLGDIPDMEEESARMRLQWHRLHPRGCVHIG